MNPILIKIGPFSIYSYGVMLAIGFILGIQLALRESQKEGLDPNKILQCTFLIFLTSIVGSRIFHIIFEDPSTYLKNPIRFFYFWKGGFVFYGGFVFAIPTVIYYTRKHKIHFWKMADILVQYVALGLSYGRMGCFLAGCCFGKYCELPWAVTFPHYTTGKGNVPLHPTQVYESFGCLMIYLILISARKYKNFHGELFAFFLVLYPILRTSLEFLRDDFRGSFFNNAISTSQLISIPFFILAIIFWIALKKRQIVLEKGLLH